MVSASSSSLFSSLKSLSETQTPNPMRLADAQCGYALSETPPNLDSLFQISNSNLFPIVRCRRNWKIGEGSVDIQNLDDEDNLFEAIDKRFLYLADTEKEKEWINIIGWSLVQHSISLADSKVTMNSKVEAPKPSLTPEQLKASNISLGCCSFRTWRTKHNQPQNSICLLQLKAAALGEQSTTNHRIQYACCS
ncbi:uncharacterized protein LOC126794525 [Argentina anserina]|uniref:uncharacterized protein LOC126794525 n=1 Tax=Argentina anserina TaxID=57926 RepID=UPI00217635BE|nr:uncharacterized protein LOC126794525 [Potentilla anserina]